MNKRPALLERLADFVLDHGLEAASLRALAKAANQSDRMLLYYFKDKDEIVSEVLKVIAARLGAQLAARAAPERLPKVVLHAALDDLMLDDDMWPFFRFWLDLAARAGRGDPICAPVALALGQDLHVWIAGQLATTDPDLRRKDATEILIGLEGVLVLKSVGLQDLVRELL